MSEELRIQALSDDAIGKALREALRVKRLFGRMRLRVRG